VKHKKTPGLWRNNLRGKVAQMGENAALDLNTKLHYRAGKFKKLRDEGKERKMSGKAFRKIKKGRTGYEVRRITRMQQ